MLLPDNIHPEQTVYYNGAIVLKALLKIKDSDLFELYSEVAAESDISFPVFLLCIDWLYLLGVLEMSTNGRIKLCILKN